MVLRCVPTVQQASCRVNAHGLEQRNKSTTGLGAAVSRPFLRPRIPAGQLVVIGSLGDGRGRVVAHDGKFYNLSKIIIIQALLWVELLLRLGSLGPSLPVQGQPKWATAIHEHVLK
eukprot:scaffold214489_cov17-Prasinocladus_malaysianus.AAC.1